MLSDKAYRPAARSSQLQQQHTNWRTDGDSEVKHRRPVSASRLQLLGCATIAMSARVRAASKSGRGRELGRGYW